MKFKGLVSCIIPSFKRTDTLRRAINSILSQTYKNLEILVVDDNLREDEYSKSLREIIKEYENDSRVKLIVQEKHINGAEARNAGIRASNGEYVAFLDDDDEWLPEKLEHQLSYLEENPIYDGCSTLYNEYKSKQIIHSCPPYTPDNIFNKIFRREVAVFTSTVLVKKNCIVNSGMFDNKLKRHQDLQMLLRFTSKYKLGVVTKYDVKLHIDSDINRPNADKIIEIKEAFFKSVEDLYKTCPSKEKQLIKAAHCYEIFFAALKQRKIAMAMIFFIKAGFSPEAYKLLYKRVSERKFIIKDSI